MAEGDISHHLLYDSKTHRKANGFTAFNVAYNIVKYESRTSLYRQIIGPGNSFNFAIA